MWATASSPLWVGVAICMMRRSPPFCPNHSIDHQLRITVWSMHTYRHGLSYLPMPVLYVYSFYRLPVPSIGCVCVCWIAELGKSPLYFKLGGGKGVKAKKKKPGHDRPIFSHFLTILFGGYSCQKRDFFITDGRTYSKNEHCLLRFFLQARLYVPWTKFEVSSDMEYIIKSIWN